MYLNDEGKKELLDAIDSIINNLETVRILLIYGGNLPYGKLDKLLPTQLEDAFCKMQDINDTYCVEVK